MSTDRFCYLFKRCNYLYFCLIVPEKVPLIWETDMQMHSKFLDRKVFITASTNTKCLSHSALKYAPMCFSLFDLKRRSWLENILYTSGSIQRFEPSYQTFCSSCFWGNLRMSSSFARTTSSHFPLSILQKVARKRLSFENAKILKDYYDYYYYLFLYIKKCYLCV